MDTKPLILFLSALPLQTGGMEGFLLHLTQGLQSNFDFVLASPATPRFTQAFEKAGGTCIHWPVRNALDRHARKSLRDLVTRVRPALVHIQDARAGLVARPALRKLGVPVVYTIHLPPYYYRWNAFTLLRQRVYATVESLLNHLATHAIVYPARRVYHEAVQKRYAPRERAKRIPLGIQLSPFLNVERKDIIALRQEMGVSAETPVIVTVARLSFEKNIGLLIDAARCLRNSRHHFVLWICGEGPESTNLAQRATGLEGCVQFLGYRADIPLLLQASDIFVLPSHYEVQPLSVMEAQASGKPCVVSDVGDMPEMVEDGVNGFVFPEGDTAACAQALATLLTDASLRERMGRAARKKALTEYGIEKMVSAYDALYREVLSARKLP